MTQNKLSCEWIRYDVVNYAMQQNFVPVIRKISLTNHSTEDFRQITVEITAQPEFALTWSKTIEILPAGQALDLGPVNFQLSGAFLAGLTERLTGLILLEIKHGEAVLYQETSSMTVLAYDQWGGLASMPEMAAAFVMPNHPDVLKIISEAAPILEKWTQNPSFDAYQSQSPNRVRNQAAAIYTAIQAHQPNYIVAPASFEEVGQRVRLPDAIFSHHMGNCFDLTLLYAACLEAVGLHPLIVFTKGHAFAGVWLIPETFSEIVQDDVTLLTKRLAAGVHELCIMESTLMCAGNHSSFQEAEMAAWSNLEDTEAFYGFLDLRRARASAIRPIPIRIKSTDGWEILNDRSVEPASIHTTLAPDAVKILDRPTEVSSIVVSKQQQWERKLLDLSLRNTLLNVRLTKSAIPLLNSQLGDLEDALADDQEFQILPKPSDWGDTERSAELFQSVSRDHPLTHLIRQEFEHKRLRADAGEKELHDKAVHLYRSARLSLEENGANTLYLALGLLKWYESTVSEQPRYAPIVMVPVEILRKSSSAGYVLRTRDEEPQINITLLEMMRQDFGSHISGLDPLPRDEKGIDLHGIFAIIRHLIMSMSRWDVVESACLGLFSFSRFVMWNDIRSRSDDLAKNKVVASLMSGRLEWDQGESFPDMANLDERCSPQGLLLPISADSSQITAVSAANADKSFVLHGPPGTGKSQTITNMIASALAGGKTVLFVAEKMAALSVVQSRLEQIGLGPFCLELHSNKSTKKAVLEQLRKTLESSRTASPEEWEREAERLSTMRNELNAYVHSLHKKYGFGYSLYDAIARHELVRSSPDVVSFDASVITGLSREQISKWSDLANEIRVAGEACGHPHDNVWEDAAITQYTPALKSQLESMFSAYLSKLSETRKAYANLTEWMGYHSTEPTPYELEQIAYIGEILNKAPDYMPSSVLGSDNVEGSLDLVGRTIDHGRARNTVRSRTTSYYPAADALAFDAGMALSEWRKADLQWFLPKMLKQNRIYKMLKGLATSGSVPDKQDTAEHLSLIIQYQVETAALKQSESTVAPLLGALWNQGEADWEAMEQANAWIRQLNQAILRLYPEGEDAFRARKHLSGLLSSGKEAFLQKYSRSIVDFLTARLDLIHIEHQIAEALIVDFSRLDNKRGTESWFDYRQTIIEQWSTRTDILREWSSWRQVRQRGIDAGLESLLSAFEKGQLRHLDVISSFERALWRAIIEYILAEDKQLASFSGRLFEEKIKSFQDTVARFELLTRQEIAARLAAKIPPLNNQAASSSEAGILLRAIKSGGRNMSLRKLFEQIPNLLNRICPCVLMSPMSVAQYLDPKFALFDLVIFDEASQLPTSEAVGAMARGRNVIVVGDPKQLPPTSFFTSSTNDDSDDGVVPEDLESILDDCLALGMPQEHLLWHYRSRHESLIAFSNRHFYENKLLTFPSPFERMSNVKWHPVNGFYDRGKTKHNRAEAEAVVGEIVRRLQDPLLAKFSIGVVTFNSIQQTLIEDLLDAAFRKDTDLEVKAAQSLEPIFVKNLENVQGDERDVILFSIGYGPDALGKVSLNFGPLNRAGGWRRLNVAVSRARHEMHVFSSLRSEHLDVSRIRAQGVSALKSFLEYAEKGFAALKLKIDQLSANPVGLESRIAEALRKEGYQVDLHVGASGYRIDLAVVNPHHPGSYLLAVLCDGSGYATGNTARDREVLRAQILRQLGWQIHRVWSPDWLENPEREISRLKEAIRDAMAGKSADSEQVLIKEAIEDQHIPVTIASGSFERSPLNPTTERGRWKATYQPVVLPIVAYSSEEFFNPTHKLTIQAQLNDIIAGEGPISRVLLYRKVLQAWGISRAGSRIEQHFDTLISTMKLNRTNWENMDFYWPHEVKPAEYDMFRISEQEQDRRNADDLPPEEIAVAIKEVLFNQVSLPTDDLIKETVKLLGYSRSGTALQKAVMNGLQEAIRRGVAVMEQNKVYFK